MPTQRKNVEINQNQWGFQYTFLVKFLVVYGFVGKKKSKPTEKPLDQTQSIKMQNYQENNFYEKSVGKNKSKPKRFCMVSICFCCQRASASKIDQKVNYSRKIKSRAIMDIPNQWYLRWFRFNCGCAYEFLENSFSVCSKEYQNQWYLRWFWICAHRNEHFVKKK